MKGHVTTRDEAFDDYIFCGADNGSAERTVLASLGGLRTDGRIGSTLWRSRSVPSPWRLGVARLSSLGDGWRERPQWHGVGIDSRAKVVGILTVAILAPALRVAGAGSRPAMDRARSDRTTEEKRPSRPDRVAAPPLRTVRQRERGRSS